MSNINLYSKLGIGATLPIFHHLDFKVNTNKFIDQLDENKRLLNLTDFRNLKFVFFLFDELFLKQ